LHFHIDQFHFPLFAQMADRTVTTLHGRQDCPDLKPLHIGFSEMPLVSVSNDQRRPIAKANFVGLIAGDVFSHGREIIMFMQQYMPSRQALADSWTLFCPECAQKMRIIMAEPAQEGMETRTYECVYGHQERITAALPRRAGRAVTIAAYRTSDGRQLGKLSRE
jgi:hypothetical protein